jgi:cardiolipin synthase A/B
MAEIERTQRRWLRTGHEVFPAMLTAIDDSRHSVCFETYIFEPGSLAERFRDALIRASKRGVRVRVLIDAFGSYALPTGFLAGLEAAGGEVRRFNPIALNRLGLRDHRKLLVCDDQVAFVGGFNVAPQYEGDGVTSGWSDIGLRIEGPISRQLAVSFDDMFARADLKHKPFFRLRKTSAKQTVAVPNEQLLLSGPGRGHSPIQRSLRRDLARARTVQLIAAYFLPTWRVRRQLALVARRGGLVQLILAGKSDVSVSQLAARSLYSRLLRAGVQIYEYQPQILHAKLVVIDDATYVGSANFDLRSFQFNYELMVRFESAEVAAEARAVFAARLGHSRPVSLKEWRESRTLWQRFKQRWAYFLLARIDPYIARRQAQSIPD